MMRIQIDFCCPSLVGGSYSSGMVRIPAAELFQWIAERTADGKPILITSVKEMLS